jgi:transcription-repair coupling factor (superfamily II helicase)
VIKKYFIKNNPKNDVIDGLLKICVKSQFLGVKIYLYELKKEYIRCINVFYENRKISRRVFTFIKKTLNLLKDDKDEKNFQNFKNEIKKNISNLALVSNSETFKIIQNWFNPKDIIAQLNNLPKLQFRYLDKIKTIYKKNLKNDKSIDIRNDTLKKEYSEILTNYIRLLLFFKKEQRVLKILKSEEEYINVNECLKVCLNKSIESSLYLYSLIGDDKSALQICLDKIKEDYAEITKNVNNYDTVLALFDEIKKLISECINICENTSESSALYYKRSNKSLGKDNNKNEILEDPGDEYWLNLFGTIYNILNDSEKKIRIFFLK